MISQHLEDRVAIVTGASRGIGFHCAHALAQAGATGVLTARRAEDAEAAAARIGAKAVGVGAHAADADQARACIELTVSHFGRLDAL